MIIRKCLITITIIFCIGLLTIASAQTQDIISSIVPNSAEAGSSDLSVSITLKNLGTPLIPPAQIIPTSIKIGDIEVSNISRDTLIITATLDIPSDEINGLKDFTITFPAPNNETREFISSAIFEVTGGIDNPVDPIDPIIINTDSCSFPIIDTGQETCYNNTTSISAPSVNDAFYGQDAQYSGLQPSYQDNGDGTVTDKNTGLMWQKMLPDAKYPWSNCVNYTDTSTLAGYDDWRLPTIKEIYSLMLFNGITGVTEESSVPYVDTDYFDFRFGGVVDASERFIDAQYATSSIYKGTTMNGNETMFGLNLVDGRIKGYPTHKNFEIRMVRGRSDYGINAFIDNDDGTISDNATGLMWDKSGSDYGMNWEDALTFANQKNAENFLGYNDWRLPNAKELHSIVNYDRSPSYTNSAAISSIFDIATITDEKGEENYPFYWTSTTHYDGPNPNKAVYISFGEALGNMNGNWIDVHGAGAQRSDPKDGDPADYPEGHGPQGDAIRIYNYVRLVRTFSISDTTIIDTTINVEIDSNEVTLFTPMGNNDTYLIYNNGDIANQWTSSSSPALSAYLLPDKSLLRTASLGRNSNPVFGQTGGAGGKVERFNWEGELIWEFEYSSDTYFSHHDVEYLPNGNILMIAWEFKSETEAIEAGRNPNLLNDGELWPDKIIEVKPTGNSGGDIVWEWHVWDHLIQDYDESKSNFGVVSDFPEKINLNFTSKQAGADWNHINAVDYNAELDQIMVTIRSFSEVWIINHNTSIEEAAGNAGDLLYRWGNPQAYDMGTADDQVLFVPHDGQWINSGIPGENDILIFNNGQGRPDGNYSSIDQFTPPVNENGEYSLIAGNSYEPTELTWNYQSNPKTDFYANHISGAQRLTDGNTLICDGTAGRFFEVTPDGETIWEYLNPYSFSTPSGQLINEVFRAVRYNLNDLGGNTIEVGIKSDDMEEVPEIFSLDQNYPNPFNPTTIIQFSIPNSVKVELNIYDIMGKKVRSLINSKYSAGNYESVWDGTNENGLSVSSGIYFYQIKAGNQVAVKKMSFMK